MTLVLLPHLTRTIRCVASQADKRDGVISVAKRPKPLSLLMARGAL